MKLILALVDESVARHEGTDFPLTLLNPLG